MAGLKRGCENMTLEEAIERFERQKEFAQAALESGIGAMPGESNGMYLERKEMAEWALLALREIKARPTEWGKTVILQNTFERGLDLPVLWCRPKDGPCTRGGRELDCREEWMRECVGKWMKKPAEERWKEVRNLFGKKGEQKDERH